MENENKILNEKDNLIAGEGIQMESNWEETISSFDELGLKKNLLRGIYGYGFEKPSPIQQTGILPIIQGRDVIAQAQSGTGKTATFAIGTLEVLDTSINEVQVLVLAPTRELAQQIAIVYKFLGEYLEVNVQVLIGGTQVKIDIKNLENGTQIVVGTPGRVLDMLKKGVLKLGHLKAFVLDEADEMLSKGFLENMKEVISHIPPECRVNLFSATMPKEIVALTSNFLNDPTKILIKNDQITLEGIKQYYVILKKEWKLESLLDIFKGLDIAQAIIYCNGKKTVEFLTEEMKKRGHMVSSIHSNMLQIDRDRVMKEFRSGATRVLITTDLLSRGIDVYQVSIVVNYDLPREKETYIHRIGRSGRYGRKGNAINFVTTDEKEELENIQKFYDTTIEALPTDLSEITYV